MPTVEELDRISALLKRLTPLADAQPGELITADNWNLAVGALIEVARALVDERDAPVPPHEHSDQVGLGWLDPRLRGLVENGPIGDPAALARVGALEQSAQRQQDALNDLRAVLDDLRGRSRELSTRDLDRQASVDIVRRKIDGIADARDDVAAVRKSLAAVQTRVDTAVQLADRLQANGEPVDLGAVKQRVDSLEKLREALQTPNGEVLDAAAIERKLAELRNTLVTEDELRDALKDVRPNVDPGQLADIEGRLKANLDTELAQREDSLRADITSTTDRRLADVGDIVARAVADARPGLVETILAQARRDLDTRSDELLAKAGDSAADQIKAAVGALADQLGGKLDAFDRGLGARVDAALAQRLPALLADLGGRVDGLSRNLDALSAKLQSNQDALKTLGAQLDEMGRATSLLQRDFGKRLDELDARVSKLDDGIDVRVKGLLDQSNLELRNDFTVIAQREFTKLNRRPPIG